MVQDCPGLGTFLVPEERPWREKSPRSKRGAESVCVAAKKKRV